LTLADGKAVMLDTFPGQVLWMDNAEHSWEILSGDVHVIAVGPKASLRLPDRSPSHPAEDCCQPGLKLSRSPHAHRTGSVIARTQQ
jgi:hypothetical protein